MKSLNPIQKNYIMPGSYFIELSLIFYMLRGLKVIKKGNDCVTLHFA